MGGAMAIAMAMAAGWRRWDSFQCSGEFTVMGLLRKRNDSSGITQQHTALGAPLIGE